MKLSSKTLRVAVAAALVAGLSAGAFIAPASAAKKDFNIWWYSKDNAMPQTWDAALKEFKAKHPELNVKFQLKTFEQINNAGIALLDSNKAPDVAEWNKGNGTAGAASKAGLLLALDKYAAKYKWNLPSSVSLYGQYTNGLMGSGKLYGVPTYGEYVGVFYNKDLFAKYNVSIPKTIDQFEAALKTFKAAGVTPLSIGGGDYQTVHNIYALTASRATQDWIKSFQLFQGKPVDPTTDANVKWAAEKFVAWNKAGYYEANASGVKADDAVLDFQKGNAAMMIGGSWLDAGMNTKISTFKYGKFVFPGTQSVGSAGNLFVIPAKGKNPDLGAEFINMLLTKKYQNYLANAGGLALFADAAAVANPLSAITATPFSQIVKKNALGMYPDWPVAGYYPVLLQAGIKLLSDGDVAAYQKTIGSFYNQNKPKA
ncbi:MAG: hypothetical protein RL130_658 [Actinomycetota bacterium]